jgi:leucyl/phenylalanyl-tRNA--protein transferase
MLLAVDDFRLHPSLRKTIRKFARSPGCEIRVDNAFESVIKNCASSDRAGQHGTWIMPQMVRAYQDFHAAGFAHSVETWVNGELVGGLYFVSIGGAVFGESMFHRATDSSKIALAALVAMCRHFGVTQIDCQQNTRHLASFGASEVARVRFIHQLNQDISSEQPVWHFSPIYWSEIVNIGP